MYRLRPPMVSRLEKTLKLCMCFGQDWMLRYPEGGGGSGAARGSQPPAPSSAPTCDLPHRAEHVQLLRVQR